MLLRKKNAMSAVPDPDISEPFIDTCIPKMYIPWEREKACNELYEFFVF